MRLAIIDLGTNTFNLLIVEAKTNGDYKVLHKNKIAVKLGEGGIENDYIEHSAFKRGIAALREHRITIDNYKVKTVFAFGTSAIRSARNGTLFLLAATNLTGLSINVITGKTEAEYIYYGVRQAVKLGNEKVLIMDIGGGSTEFIIADSNNIFWKESYKLGASRLLEKFKPSDPITKDEITQIETHIDSILPELFERLKEFKVTQLIGSSGSFDTLAEIIWYKYYDQKDFEKDAEYTFKLDEYDAIHEQLIASTLEERLNTPGLAKMRADMIVVSSIFAKLIIQKAGIETFKLSAYALKEGVIWKILN